MSPMKSKRSTHINLSRMRKGFSAKPLAIGIAAVFLSACGNKQEAKIYTSVDDCVQQNPEQSDSCKTAYQDALQEAQRTGPKYNTQGDCEAEFGANQCNRVESASSSFFMPFMAGYMLSNLMSPGRYYSQPMFTSYSSYSPYRNHWVGADGYDFGDNRKRSMQVSEKSLQAKPAVTKTISRGGFGSTVRAKSSWGSSKKGGWGG